MIHCANNFAQKDGINFGNHSIKNTVPASCLSMNFTSYKACIAFCLLVAFASTGLSQNVGAAWVIAPILDIDNLEISPYPDDSRFVVTKGGKSGVFNKKGEQILPIEYGNITLQTCGWIMATKGGKRLLFNKKAQPIGLPYEKFRPSNDGLAVVFKDNLCGLINMQGEEVVPVRFASYSSEGMYIFKNGAEELRYERPEEFATENQRRLAVKKEKYLLPGFKIIGVGLNGLSNKKGEIVVPALYKFASAHKDGYIVASFDSKTWGVIDVKHNTLYPFTASKIGDWTKNRLLPVRSDKQWALLKFPSAEVVIPFGAFDYIEVYDPEKEVFKAQKGDKTGLINARQEIILPFEYTYISQSDHYVQELACSNNKRAYWNSRIGYISECMFDKIQNLKDSLIIVKKDTLWAVIDAKNGKEIIPFSPFEIEKKEEYFHSKKKYNFKMQQTAKGKLNGLYDRKGKLVFPHDSVDIHVFPDLTFFIMPDYLKSSTQCEHRAADGKILRTLPKDGVEVRDRYWIFNSKNPEGKYQATNFSYLDKPGQENYYSMVGKLNENLRMVKKGVYFGFTDNEGKVIIQPVFEAAEPSKDGYIRVKYEGKWGVLQNPLFDYFE